jgi:hypothetical protein
MGLLCHRALQGNCFYSSAGAQWEGRMERHFARTDHQSLAVVVTGMEYFLPDRTCFGDLTRAVSVLLEYSQQIGQFLEPHFHPQCWLIANDLGQTAPRMFVTADQTRSKG